MADAKISDLTAVGSLAVGDLFVVVDISDTTDAGSGTTKKATGTQVFTLFADTDGTLAANSDTVFPTQKAVKTYAQPLDGTLTALAAQNWVANALPIGSGADTLAQVTFAANTFPARASTGNLVAKTITDFGLSILDDVDAAAVRTTLVLGTAALKNTGTSGDAVPLLNASNEWSASLGQAFIVSDSGTNDKKIVIAEARLTSGTPAAGFGIHNHTYLQSSTTVNQDAATDTIEWATATHASRKARRTFGVHDQSTSLGSPREVLRMESSGSAPMVGFLGASAVVRQTGDIGTALVTLGLMSGTPTVASAATLTTARLINGVSFNGSANILAPDYSNIVDNGNFNVWQRGATFAAIATGAFSADRFSYQNPTSAAVHTITRSTDVPTVAQAGSLSLYSLKIDCTTADASIAATDRCFLNHAVEGYDFLAIAQREFTLSFWVKATKTGVYCVAFRNNGADRSYIAEYTVNVTATWEYKTITVPASPTGGTWDYTTGVGLNVGWALNCGSTYQTTANAWQTGNFVGTASQVNATDSTANDFYLSQIMLVPGSTAYPIQPTSYSDDLAKCQRYLQSYSGLLLGLALNASVLYHCGAVTFPCEMRAAPTLVAGATYTVNAGSAGTPSLANTTNKGTGFVNASANWTTNAIVAVTCFLTAEI